MILLCSSAATSHFDPTFPGVDKITPKIIQCVCNSYTYIQSRHFRLFLKASSYNNNKIKVVHFGNTLVAKNVFSFFLMFRKRPPLQHDLRGEKYQKIIKLIFKRILKEKQFLN